MAATVAAGERRASVPSPRSSLQVFTWLPAAGAAAAPENGGGKTPTPRAPGCQQHSSQRGSAAAAAAGQRAEVPSPRSCRSSCSGRQLGGRIVAPFPRLQVEPGCLVQWRWQQQQAAGMRPFPRSGLLLCLVAVAAAGGRHAPLPTLLAEPGFQQKEQQHRSSSNCGSRQRTAPPPQLLAEPGCHILGQLACICPSPHPACLSSYCRS